MKVFRVLFFVVLTLGLATPAAVWALPGSTTIFHPQEPGSVLVFHKFLRGFVDSGDGTQLPASAFEISLQCPPEKGAAAGCGVFSGTSIFPSIPIHAHWVCPGDPTAPAGARNCPDSDFILHLTINGTVWISPEGNLTGTDVIPPPPCDKGFLIMWVENPLSPGTPTSWNGLTGDAVVRHSNVTDVEAYTPVAIQAVTPFLMGTSSGQLDFDGFSYQDLTSGISGTLHYEDANTQTFLTLLSLDVALANNGYNNVVDVPFNFYNAGEHLTSASTRFVCWTEVELTAINGGLTVGTQGSAKGFFTAQTGNGDTLLGLIETTEAIPAANGVDPFRSYAYSVYYDPSFETSTTFFQNGGDRILGAIGTPLPVAAPATPAPAPAPVSSPVPSVPVLTLL
jgi:hypothetical protein